MRRSVWLIAGSVVVGLILLLQGCGQAAQKVEVASVGVGVEQQAPGDPLPAGTTAHTGPVVPAGTSATSVSVISGEVGQWGPPAPDISSAFAEVRKQLGDMVLYEPGTLPAGSELHHCWWPASSGQEYDEQGDSGEPNPRVTGIDASPEVRVLLKVAGGWVEILEGVRGDLGELPNEAAGDVSGHPARSYRLLGGYLVQWSDDGRWYAVYGRGIGLDDVERIAHGMHAGRI